MKRIKRRPPDAQLWTENHADARAQLLAACGQEGTVPWKFGSDFAYGRRKPRDVDGAESAGYSQRCPGCGKAAKSGYLTGYPYIGKTKDGYPHRVWHQKCWTEAGPLMVDVPDDNFQAIGDLMYATIDDLGIEGHFWVDSGMGHGNGGGITIQLVATADVHPILGGPRPPPTEDEQATLETYVEVAPAELPESHPLASDAPAPKAKPVAAGQLSMDDEQPVQLGLFS